MAKVLITGGLGFIGTFITKKLIEQGDKVLIYDAFLNFVDPNKSKYNDYLKIRLDMLGDKPIIVRGDIRHKAHFQRVMDKFRPDLVINMAALPIATASNNFSEDAMSINLNGVVNILESLKSAPYVKRFLYTSSSMVYGNFE